MGFLLRGAFGGSCWAQQSVTVCAPPHRDADETKEWIEEKNQALNTDNYGHDLASVQALQRKHEGFERDLAALGDKVRGGRVGDVWAPGSATLPLGRAQLPHVPPPCSRRSTRWGRRPSA